MKTPPFLLPGDPIAIVATARKISSDDLLPALNKIREWGFNAVLGKSIYSAEDQFAGSDELRLSDLQQMLDDASIKAVLCARGGYGTVRIIDNLDFSGFKINPKWVVGYSDITVLHSHIHTNCEVETLHATMPLNFPPDGSESDAIRTLYNALTGKKLAYHIRHHEMSRQGRAEGTIIGGNLSLLYALSSTPSDIDTSGKILFIEDLDEYLYHIDRMMQQLKRSGKLKNLAGLIVGGMSDMKDNSVPFGKTAYEIIAETVQEYHYPVCMGFPAGHTKDNRALILGRRILLNVGTYNSDIEFYQ